MISPTKSVPETISELRTRVRVPLTMAHRLALLRELSDFWFERTRGSWRPMETAFPYAQVRHGLPPLVYGLMDAEQWVERAQAEASPQFVKAGVVALVLAGNTPLLAWPPLVAALLAGHAVFVKLSRDESVWTPLFVESLAAIAPELAERVHMEYFPGESEQTAALCQNADRIIAYGSDESLAALREQTPLATPFYGFGYAISVGIVSERADPPEPVSGFAYDALLYGQSGCLSAQTVFVFGGRRAAESVAQSIADAMPSVARSLQVQRVTDMGVAQTVRRARDLALFEGANVVGDDALRWTVAVYPPQERMPEPVGHGVLSVVPFREASDLMRLTERFKGKISGVAASRRDELVEDFAHAMGVSYRCAPGRLQSPPLDWANGGIDLLAELMVR